MSSISNPPVGMPRITPYLFYNDVRAALAWLERVFGFQPKGEAVEMEPGMVHAEMAFKDGFIMLGTPTRERGGSSPADLSGIHQSLYVYVDDVDGHYARVRDAGHVTLTEPTDMFWGDRMYAVKDLEGHHWSFAQHVRDVSLDELRAAGQVE